MSDILEQADQLYDALEALLSLGIRTASGEAVGTVSLEGLKTDGRTFANALFPKGIPRLPSETLSVGSLYDTSQAWARMASSISMTRKDYYVQAAKDAEIRFSRLKYERFLHTGALNVSVKPHKMQTAVNEQ